jgi:DNA-binding NtrC family response regulator
MKRILIVDDERNMQTVLRLLFVGAGYEVVCADSAEDALGMVRSGESFSVIVSDLKLEGMDGIAFLKELHKAKVGVPFVLITAYGTVERAVEAMKFGAVDVVTKPFDNQNILNIVARNAKSRGASAGDKGEVALIFKSAKMAEISSLIERIGPAPSPVLLTGESGTGKEVIARLLHAAYCGGDFSRRPFVSVNCPAVPESLIESELFGYRKGAFTGAAQDMKGKIETANGGTVFFDEIGDLPHHIQPKLLRLLENKTYDPLGGGHTKEVDIRIVCATNRDLPTLVREGKFREDLLYRINTFTFHLPSLRERPEDIPLLAAHFMEKYATQMRKEIRGFDQDAMERLVSYPWPGNVRELRNAVERAVVLCASGTIHQGDLPGDLLSSKAGHGVTPSSSVRTELAEHLNLVETERRMLLDALEQTEWNVCAAARRLGITRNTLRYRMQKHGIVALTPTMNQELADLSH